MASIRKAGKKFLAEVRIKGANRSKTFFTKREAQEWAFEQERLLGKHGNALPSKTFGQAMQRYAEEISPTRKGYRWEKVRLAKLQRDRIANIALIHLRREDFEDWIGRQTVSKASIRRELTLMQSVLKKCRTAWKWMVENPFTDLERPKASRPRFKRWPDENIARLLVALQYAEGQPVTKTRQIIAVGFLFALETAMRQGEIWGLEWQDIDLEARTAHLRETKNGSTRDVPLSGRAVTLLKSLPGERLGRVFNTCQTSSATIFRRAVQESGNQGLTFHDSRHEAITRLSRKLGHLELARMVGHNDLRSLNVYYNPTASELAKKLD
jgi:integrase